MANHELIILDDIFPYLLSSFRIAEFNAVLKYFASAVVFTSGKKYRILGKKRSFNDVFSEYKKSYPEHAHQIFRYHPKRNVSARLCYLMFLNNADFFLDYLSTFSIPFVLELYPGGGFRLGEEESDRKLMRVTSSPLLLKVIATQRVTFNYLLNKRFCTPDQVEFVYGGVLPVERLPFKFEQKRFYSSDKDWLNICFVAHKYMSQGRDKGYDVFINVAHILAPIAPDVHFHVVGPFDAEDVDISDIKTRLTFHGSHSTDFFPDFYAGMDLILSPNAPHILSPGAFDGFPTGACVEAGLCGVAVFACDELGLNPFINGEELVIIPRNATSIADIIMKYRNEPELLYRIARNGQRRFCEAFSAECQVAPRIRILESLLAREIC
ncbi:glycosyltransferase family 4 protein [Geobacter hydrogenophilus]|uniref:glycosyltransferase family 4 protein n=1 Tax=Geobacter hydrogenophilus TaxID=40983 RepID=UPI001BDAFFF1|nr:glycosyltransferase family 4 protein [Geobacter hydrogenophilus]MBT0892288.1 glycosyltransferase family 4 protein [Geobacter hydrogenophilus]